MATITSVVVVISDPSSMAFTERKAIPFVMLGSGKTPSGMGIVSKEVSATAGHVHPG